MNLKLKLVAKLQQVCDDASLLPFYLEGDVVVEYLEMEDSDQEDAAKTEEKLKQAFTDSTFIAYGKLLKLR